MERRCRDHKRDHQRSRWEWVWHSISLQCFHLHHSRVQETSAARSTNVANSSEPTISTGKIFEASTTLTIFLNSQTTAFSLIHRRKIFNQVDSQPLRYFVFSQNCVTVLLKCFTPWSNNFQLAADHEIKNEESMGLHFDVSNDDFTSPIGLFEFS